MGLWRCYKTTVFKHLYVQFFYWIYFTDVYYGINLFTVLYKQMEVIFTKNRNRKYYSNIPILLPVSIFCKSNHWRRSLTSLQFSRWRPLTSRINFRFHFNSAVVLRRSEYLNVPHFTILTISQATAELWLLPIWKNERSPYWNSTSCYYFNMPTVIGISFCIGSQNFNWIGPLAA